MLKGMLYRVRDVKHTFLLISNGQSAPKLRKFMMLLRKKVLVCLVSLANFGHHFLDHKLGVIVPKLVIVVHESIIIII